MKPAPFDYARASSLDEAISLLAGADGDAAADLLKQAGQHARLKKLEASLRAIAEDGAQCICLGSTAMYQAGDYLAERLPVPVVNPGPLS